MSARGDEDMLGAPDRLIELDRAGLMDTLPEENFDRWTRLASNLIKAPMVVMTLVDAHRAFFKSDVGLPAVLQAGRTAPLSHSICKHVVASGAPLVFADGRDHPLVRDNPAVRDFGIISYAGMPLTTRSGATLGVFCAIDGRPREWTAAERALLADIAASVTAEIELRLATAAKQDLLTIVSHDLKSPLTAIGLSATLATPHVARLAVARRAVDKIAAAVGRIEAVVHQILDGGHVSQAMAPRCGEPRSDPSA